MKPAASHELVGSGDNKQIVLSATTAQLRQYLQKAPAAAFAEEAVLCRVK
jgi:hypothetical protein